MTPVAVVMLAFVAYAVAVEGLTPDRAQALADELINPNEPVLLFEEYVAAMKAAKQ